MQPSLLSILIFFLPCTHSQLLLWSDPSHCPAACVECSNQATEVCVVSPVLMQFSCVCLVHHALCNGFAQNVVFYSGTCDSRPYYFLGPSLPLYTFLGVEIVPLRVREAPSRVKRPSIPASEMDVPDAVPQKLARIQNVPFDQDVFRQPMKVMDLRGDNRRSTAALSVKGIKPKINDTEICSMFFKEDKKFQKSHKMKHFTCLTANPQMIQKNQVEKLNL